mmetsp:Transcript_52748/g.103132  ORF Transcript_52748/g.103132 Transcript_52748/m.103132 type:complete len:88 (+) Transcript_52748:1510-1773(+)
MVGCVVSSLFSLFFFACLLFYPCAEKRERIRLMGECLDPSFSLVLFPTKMYIRHFLSPTIERSSLSRTCRATLSPSVLQPSMRRLAW